MDSQECITFEPREATVLVDVLQWACDADDLDDRPGDVTIETDPLPDAIDTLEEDSELHPSDVPREQLGAIMRMYADALKQQAWDIEDSANVFEFFEETFQRIESQLQETGTAHS